VENDVAVNSSKTNQEIPKCHRFKIFLAVRIYKLSQILSLVHLVFKTLWTTIYDTDTLILIDGLKMQKYRKLFISFHKSRKELLWQIVFLLWTILPYLLIKRLKASNSNDYQRGHEWISRHSVKNVNRGTKSSGKIKKNPFNYFYMEMANMLCYWCSQLGKVHGHWSNKINITRI